MGLSCGLVTPRGAPKNFVASARANPASCVASKKAAIRSPRLISAAPSDFTAGGRPKRIWMAPASLELEGFVIQPNCRLERADQIADHIFRRIVKEGGEKQRPAGPRLQLTDDMLDQQAMLGNRKRVIPARLSVPARDPGKAVRDYPRSRCREARGRADRGACRSASAARRGAGLWFRVLRCSCSMINQPNHGDKTMSIAKVLVPVTGGQRDAGVLANAIAARVPSMPMSWRILSGPISVRLGLFHRWGVLVSLLMR